MALPAPISPSQTDCKSPIDDVLMDSIRINLDYLDSAISAGSAIAIQWKVNGRLGPLRSFKQAVDCGSSTAPFTPSACRVALRRSGFSGQIMFDALRHKKLTLPITGINAKTLFDTQSVARVNVPASTQSISLATPTLNTQAITFAKPTINITSIIQAPGVNQWRLNLDALPDADYLVGDSILVAGAASGVNNGYYTINEVNQSDYPCLVITNALGVAQTTATGTVQLQTMSYDQTNPVNATYFAPGLSVITAGHTDSIGNGTWTIRKINQSGNNIWIHNPLGVTQGGAAGTCQSACWSYNQSAPVDASYVVGETANMATHTTPANNGNFFIVGVNDGGSNLIVHNPVGVAQGGAAGTVNCNRWIYTALAALATTATAGEKFKMSGHTSSANDGEFVAVEIDRGGGANYNVVVHNVNGVAQAGVAGVVSSELKLVKFASDQSAVFTTDVSYLEIKGAQNNIYNAQRGKYLYKVVGQNFGGGANYNATIKEINGVEQLNPLGFVTLEAKSIFSQPQTLAADSAGMFIGESWVYKDCSADLVNNLVTEGEIVGLYFLEMQKGQPEDFSLTVS